eukprot:gene9637-9797_t
MTQAESCLQTFGGYQQLTAPGLQLAQPPSLETALQSPPGSNKQLDRAVCLATPAEQVEEELMVLDEGSNGIAGAAVRTGMDNLVLMELIDELHTAEALQRSTADSAILELQRRRRWLQALQHLMCLLWIWISLMDAGLILWAQGRSKRE